MASNVLNSYRYLSTWNPNEKVNVLPKIQVTTAFLQQGDRILVLQRAKKDSQHKLWGIPGGKIEKHETPLEGLVREVNEETGLKIATEAFHLLGSALCHTPCDGTYGLYIFHAIIPDNCHIQINPEEHYAYQWVSIEEFESLNLLTAQREAYLFVKEKLIFLINFNSIKMVNLC
ncbi:MAG: NUDIX hydrolase [Chlamydiales bacterium]|nr:NUDIX hydrolase [Chlamydiales bacterium]MBY0529921.1 NUDIX hydrolase [Rhabdochlamydiaceae bacterium]